MMEYITDPIDGFYPKVKDLAELAELTGCPNTSQQQVYVGYLIVNKQRMFREDVRKWIRRPPAKNMDKFHGLISVKLTKSFVTLSLPSTSWGITISHHCRTYC